MRRLEKYSKFPLNIYYRISAELGITCLTLNEKRIIFFYLVLLINSFVKSMYNIIKMLGGIRYTEIKNYLEKFYK